MKKTLYIIAAALGVVSCCREYSAGTVPDGEGIGFSLRLEIPSTSPGTRSVVSGTEGIHGMQMLCFDENGLYVGLGSVTLRPSGDTGGVIEGQVPSVTSAIHFIANAGLVPQDSWRGLPEALLVGSVRASAQNTHIVYWGYHREDNPGDLESWLSAVPSNTVSLLRDRAKVTLGDVEEDIHSIRFTVCNGLELGQVAPYDKSRLCFDYDAPLTIPDHVSRAVPDPSEFVSRDSEQFLFEDENTMEDPVKVILETTYAVSSGGEVSYVVKYHQVLLMDSEYSMYRIRRNHRYHIIIGTLPASIGYDSFDAAVEGQPSNNRTVFVHDIVPQVGTEGYELEIKDGTTRVFHDEGGTSGQWARVDFSFMKNGVPDEEASADDFTAVWLSNKYVCPPGEVPAVHQGDSAGQFYLLMRLYTPITDDLKSGRILLTDTRYGLSRYINIYSITSFEFDAALVQTEDPLNPYILSFTVPDNYPPTLFPMEVKICTEHFKPTAAQNGEKALGVTVGDTMSAFGESWNYWYTFETDCPGRFSVSLAPVEGRSLEDGRIWLSAPHFDAVSLSL